MATTNELRPWERSNKFPSGRPRKHVGQLGVTIRISKETQERLAEYRSVDSNGYMETWDLALRKVLNLVGSCEQDHGGFRSAKAT